MTFIRAITATVTAALAALALSGSSLAAEPAAVRIEPTVHPLLKTTTAKLGGPAVRKPDPAPHIPGPVIKTRVRHNNDGTVSTWCETEHRELSGTSRGHWHTVGKGDPR